MAVGTGSRGTKIALWALALVLMAGAAVYQRRTGPTNPVRGAFESGGERHEYVLTRSAVTTEDALVTVPRPSRVTGATLHCRRYPTDEAFLPLPMVFEEDGDVLAGFLPRQPAAGKLEYYVELSGPGGTVRLPDSREDFPIIRFKGPVPSGFLIPHIALMFLAVLFGLRTGLAAAFRHPEVRLLAWVTLGLMTVGGMVLGPIVQKYAFGEFWTGFPNGRDLTDNKMLIMWLVWLATCGILGLKARPQAASSGRVAVVAATVVMLVVYLIPHSLRGSELNYEKLEDGVSPTEAVETGG